MFPSLFDLNQGKRPFSTGFAAADLSTSACEQLGHNSNGSSSSSLPLMMHQQVARGKSFHPLSHLPSRVRVSTYTRTPTLTLMVHISPVEPSPTDTGASTMSSTPFYPHYSGGSESSVHIPPPPGRPNLCRVPRTHATVHNFSSP